MNQESDGPALPPEILDYYNRAREESRMESGVSRLEFARTREILQRDLPPPPARVLDVGGGSGPYSLWLADAGYEAHLVEPVPRLAEEARRRSSAATRPLASIAEGDARRLSQADGSVDAVLLLGPLYHLTDRSGRLLALGEAFRALKPGGVIFAAGISRYASALGGVARGLSRDPRFVRILNRDLTDGQHRNETEELEYFTTAYFHLPGELRDEVESAGFNKVRLLGVEGPGWLLSDFEERWADPGHREDLLRLARLLEGTESVVGVSAHLLAVGRKPAGG